MSFDTRSYLHKHNLYDKSQVRNQGSSSDDDRERYLCVEKEVEVKEARKDGESWIARQSTSRSRVVYESSPGKLRKKLPRDLSPPPTIDFPSSATDSEPEADSKPRTKSKYITLPPTSRQIKLPSEDEIEQIGRKCRENGKKVAAEEKRKAKKKEEIMSNNVALPDDPKYLSFASMEYMARNNLLG